ncbi:MAG: hypothetical protein EOS65_09105 [Mesorhizobium sp.]|uniref:hypothetical protein n=1 Tax=Mesorhizobium sp. TaxID=1871066 RepID=UPI000FE4B46A|nr:hypothetical protein [Mesorhizobium sp.]RWF42420.1 MAG: hypothetical protein EOS65_09105 [Mesorhizobium sp.]TIX13634.1 MAG: hypothetical protein E5V41_20780 [Mesorhizobium sp.]TJW08614.1 MAG: hypothetical protein E5W97_05190 [Mesorhizobium sp.]
MPTRSALSNVEIRLRISFFGGNKMQRNAVFALAVCAISLVFGASNAAQAQCTLPYQLTNGQPADATQVMANYNALIDCINAVALPNDLRELGPFAPPTAASFTVIDSPSSITPTVTDVAKVGLLYSVPLTSNATSFPGAYRAVPVAPWTLTFRAKYPTLMGNYPSFGVWIKDSSGKMLGAIMESRSSSLRLS